MGRYSKSYSNYVLRKKHMGVEGGTIFERDWVTIGERHKLEPGKRPTYGSGNFVFTDNSRINTKKRHKYGTEVSRWTYGDVANAQPDTNIVKVNMRSNDMRDFAYYGSCVELVRTAIIHIIEWFPASVTASQNVLYTTEDGKKRYGISNPLGIDFTHSVSLADMEGINPMRLLTVTWPEYSVNGSLITSYLVSTNFPYECAEDNEGLVVQTVEMVLDNGTSTVLYGYYSDGEIVFTTQDPKLVIEPKSFHLKLFFDSLSGFEKILLDNTTKPCYTAKLLTPVESDGVTRYVYRNYTWPSDGRCITAEGGAYDMYVQSLYDIAERFDSEWCDNLYRRMTHEAIKNFDWTYTKDYNDGDELYNIEGGNIMASMLKVIGRQFDDLKRGIDGIRMTNNISYDGCNNITDAELTDRLDMRGWDTVSVIPSLTDGNGYAVAQSSTSLRPSAIYRFTAKGSYDVFGSKSGFFKSVTSGHRMWYSGKDPVTLTASDVDTDFMRTLLLFTRHICRHKGTVHSVEMMMAMFGLGRDVDYELHEGYHTVETKPMFYADECTGEVTDLTYEMRRSLSNVNNYDTQDSFYDKGTDEYEFTYRRIPMGEMTYKNLNYRIPLYEKDKEYDGFFTFQSEGGWAKKSIDMMTGYDYTETLSYLRTVDNIGELLDVSPHAVVMGDVYYVYSITDYAEYFNDTEVPVSHFFVVTNEFDTSTMSSWRNIQMDPDDESFVDDEAYRKAMYMDNIISVNTGNNPHTGYGMYDMGGKYLEYMRTPFSYAASHYRMDNDILESMMSDEYTFNISNNGYLSHMYGDGEDADEGKVRNAAECEDGNDGILHRYFLNDKTFVIKNMHEKDTLFTQYFMNVIFPFVAQMIPATTILVLEGFSD